MNIAMVVAGSWGTTLALVLHQNRHRVRCWAYEKSIIEDIEQTGTNKAFLPDVAIPDSLMFSTNLAFTLENCNVIVLATPVQAVRQVLKQISSKEMENVIWINVAKGIEKGSLKRVSEVIHEISSCLLYTSPSPRDRS